MSEVVAFGEYESVVILSAKELIVAPRHSPCWIIANSILPGLSEKYIAPETPDDPSISIR